MIGRILGGIEVIGLVGLIAHYTKIEQLTGGYFYLVWSMVLIPLYLVAMLLPKITTKKISLRTLTIINFIWIIISIIMILTGFYLELLWLIFMGGISLLMSSLIFIVFGDFKKDAKSPTLRKPLVSSQPHKEVGT
jgi:hypothetical protein